MQDPAEPLNPTQPPEPRVISHSEIESAARCGLQHQLSYIERWTRPRSETTAAGKGTLWHSVMEAHFNRLAKHQAQAREERADWRRFSNKQALAEAKRDVAGVLDSIVDDEVRDLIDWMYRGYTDHFGVDPEWEILGVEFRGEVPLDPPIAERVLESDEILSGIAPRPYRFKFLVDLIVRQGDTGIWVVDHKTVHNFPRGLDLDLDPQFDRYTWALRKLGWEVFGQQHNMARRQKLKVKEQKLEDRFRREMTYRSDLELEQAAQDAWLIIDNRYRQQEQADLFGIESARTTSSRHCSFLCDFTEPCLAARKGVALRPYLQAQGMAPDFTRH